MSPSSPAPGVAKGQFYCFAPPKNSTLLLRLEYFSLQAIMSLWLVSYGLLIAAAVCPGEHC
jgi:hypothetical protein